MIQNLTFGILFLKRLFRASKFFVFVLTFQWTLSELFLISDFLKKVSKPTKTSEKDDSFYNTVSLKKPHSFCQSQLTWHWQQIAPATQPKPFLILQIFQQTCFCLAQQITFALRLNSFLNVARCLDLVKCFTIFHFNWKSL